MAIEIGQINHVLTLLECSARQARELANIVMHNRTKANHAPSVAVATGRKGANGAPEFADPRAQLLAMAQQQTLMLRAQIEQCTEHAQGFLRIIEEANAGEEKNGKTQAGPRLVTD